MQVRGFAIFPSSTTSEPCGLGRGSGTSLPRPCLACREIVRSSDADGARATIGSFHLGLHTACTDIAVSDFTDRGAKKSRGRIAARNFQIRASAREARPRDRHPRPALGSAACEGCWTSASCL